MTWIASHKTTLLTIFIVQLLSLRTLAKFMPYPYVLTPVALLLLAVTVSLVFHPPARLKRLLFTPWPALLVVAALVLAAAFVYPAADGRKAQGGGSDADDALIDGARHLLEGRNPYLFRTYLDGPISPGPGWIILTAPLSLAGMEPMLAPLALSVFLFAAFTGWKPRSVFSLTLFASPLSWELTATGNDLLPLALLFTATLLRLSHAPSWRAVIALGALLGVLSTGRIALFFLPLLAGFMLWPSDKKKAMAAAAAGMAAQIALHGAFAYGLAEYSPLHLLGKAQTYSSLAFRLLAFLWTLIAAFFMLKNHSTWMPSTHMALTLGVPFFWMAFVDLSNNQFDLSLWYGVNYLMVAAPAVFLALSTNDR